MPSDASPGLRSFPLPADTSADTRVLYFFRPAALPVLLGSGLYLVAALLLPVPAAAKVALGVLPPLGVLGAVAADVPARVARRKRLLTDDAARYLARPTPGNVRAGFADGLLGVALSVLPPGWTWRDADALEAERAAWVRVGRRLKAARATAAVSVEMVADDPPRPGWEVPADLALPPGAARFAAMRREHFAALVAEGRAQRPQVLLRIAARPRGGRPELDLDRLTNGVAGELQAVGVLAVPADLRLLGEIAEEQQRAWGASVPRRDDGRAAPAPAAPLAPDAPGAEASVAAAVTEAPTPAAAPARPALRGLPRLLLEAVLSRREARGAPAAGAPSPAATAPPVASPDAPPASWPDIDALSAAAGRTWDISLAVLGALPRVGATTALLGWAAGRPVAEAWALVDGNLERPGGLHLAAGLPPQEPGWRSGRGSPQRLSASMDLLGPGRSAEGDDALDPAEFAQRLLAAARAVGEAGGRRVALDLGSPPALDGRMRAHPLVRLAAEQAAAIAVVTRQDAASLFAAKRLLTALAALGAVEARVWVAAYDTADPVTLAEMRAALGAEVEEAPFPPGRPPAAAGAADPLTGALMRATGEAVVRAALAAAARTGAPTSVLFLDVDDLKRANDTAGHEAGDRLLRDAAAAARGALRGGDLLVRWGGDEFVALLRGADAASAVGAAARVRRAWPGFSIGVATAGAGESPDAVLRRADAAMYADKAARKAGR